MIKKELSQKTPQEECFDEIPWKNKKQGITTTFNGEKNKFIITIKIK
ncbi:MAG: hypothetical protein OEX08_02935 [Candidatus Nomurabacteria bacterium]|nr:hypothetical protein [Candidatus Nomurabacteria bacterium]